MNLSINPTEHIRDIISELRRGTMSINDSVRAITNHMENGDLSIVVVGELKITRKNIESVLKTISNKKTSQVV